MKLERLITHVIVVCRAPLPQQNVEQMCDFGRISANVGHLFGRRAVLSSGKPFLSHKTLVRII